MFHKEGAQSILLGTIFTVIVLLLSDNLIDTNWLKMTIQIAALLLLIIILQFFRNPKRTVELNENHIIAPVDGKVVVIEEVFEEIHKSNLSKLDEKFAKVVGDFNKHDLLDLVTEYSKDPVIKQAANELRAKPIKISKPKL